MLIKQKLLIGSVIAAVILLLTSLLFGSKRKPTETMVIPMPTKVAVPTREKENYYSETGAIYISPTDSAYTVDWLIGDLRTKLPVETTAFLMIYDYKIDKFMVSTKDKSDINRQMFYNWISEAGYDQIPADNFIIE